MIATLRRWTTRMLLVALTAACGTSLPAADPAAPDQPGPAALPRITVNKPLTPDAAAAPNADHMIATMLAIANEEEVALGKLVDSKSQNPNMRAFAERMIKDHSAFLQTLQRFGGEPGFNDEGVGATATGPEIHIGGPRPAPATQPAPGVAQPALRPGLQIDVQVGDNQPGHLDAVAIKRQIAEQCLASARQDFSGANLHQAELEYVGAQIAMHKQMLDVLKVVRPHASADLQAAIDQATQVTQAHLEHARQLLTSMIQEASPGARTTTR
jgi:predicted outer membrane protein